MAVFYKSGKLNVFISYSRADEAFADELKLGLEDKGYPVEIDKHSIRQGEEWKARLSELIARCGTVVFVLSPDSARSATCHWEVEEAHAQAKRIIPVLHRGLQEEPKGKQEDGTPWPSGTPKAPERLSLLNYPRFDQGRSFMLGRNGLVQALEDDLPWIDAHSRLATRARDWEDGERATIRLMSGADIAAAKRLVAERKPTAPPLLPVQLAFIQASEAHEATQTSNRERELEERERLLRTVLARTRLGLAVSALLTVVALAAGAWAWNRTIIAGDALLLESQQQATIAQNAEADAVKRRRDAERSKSASLANVAITKIAEGDATTAALLAIEAIPENPNNITGEYSYKAPEALYLAFQSLGPDLAILPHRGYTSTTEFSRDGQRILTASGDKTLATWDAKTGRKISVMTGHTDAVAGAYFFGDDSKVVSFSGDGTVRFWETGTGLLLKTFSGGATRVEKLKTFANKIAWLAYSIASDNSSSHFDLWLFDATDLSSSPVVLGQGRFEQFSFSEDGSRLIAHSNGSVTTYSTIDGKIKQKCDLDKDISIRNIAFSLDNNVAIASTDGRLAGQIKRFNLMNCMILSTTQLPTLPGTYSYAELVTPSLDGYRFLVVSGAVIFQYDDHAASLVGTPMVVSDKLTPPNGIMRTAVNLKAGLVAAAYIDGHTRLWDIDTGKMTEKFIGDVAPLRANRSYFVDISPDGRSVVAASEDGTAKLWRVNSKAKVAKVHPFHSLSDIGYANFFFFNL